MSGLPEAEAEAEAVAVAVWGLPWVGTVEVAPASLLTSWRVLPWAGTVEVSVALLLTAWRHSLAAHMFAGEAELPGRAKALSFGADHTSTCLADIKADWQNALILAADLWLSRQSTMHGCRLPIPLLLCQTYAKSDWCNKQCYSIVGPTNSSQSQGPPKGIHTESNDRQGLVADTSLLSHEHDTPSTPNLNNHGCHKVIDNIAFAILRILEVKSMTPNQRVVVAELMPVLIQDPIPSAINNVVNHQRALHNRTHIRNPQLR